MSASVLSLFSLEGKTALITGGTRGIGQSMAYALAEAGADIILIQVRLASICTATEIKMLTNLSAMNPIHKPAITSSLSAVA